MTATVPAPSVRRFVRAATAAAAAAAATVAGVWVAGGLITNDFRASMALTGAWFVIAGATALKTRRIPLVAGFLIAAAATGGYLAATTLRDKTVHETVVTGMPESSGRFVSGEHATRGTARVIRLAGGRRVLTLTRFETAAGPDLRVRIARTGTTDGAVDLGALKGNRGDQQYDLPEALAPRDHTVLIWCRAFSALFGSARLEAS